MPGKALFDIAAVREAVRNRVEESSMRVVAEEIGISRGGLESFLSGREPYTRSRLRLMQWWARHRVRVGPGGAKIYLDAAIAVLADYISDAETDTVRRRRLQDISARLSAAAERARLDG